MPLASRTMYEAALAKKVQDLGNIMTAKALIRRERQLERCALEMADQNMNVFRIDEAHFRRLAQKIFRVTDDELIKRCARSHQHGHRHSAAPAGTPHALPG